MKQRTEKEKKRRDTSTFEIMRLRDPPAEKKVQGKTPTHKKKASRVLRSCKGTLNERAFFSFSLSL